MAKKNKPLPPKGRPTPEGAPPVVPPTAPVRSHGPEGGDGFDDMDDFFFGTEAGAFSLDEDYDPFDADGNPVRPPGGPGRPAPAPGAGAAAGGRSAPGSGGAGLRSVGAAARSASGEDDVATSTRLMGPEQRLAVAAGLAKEGWKAPPSAAPRAPGAPVSGRSAKAVPPPASPPAPAAAEAPPAPIVAAVVAPSVAAAPVDVAPVEVGPVAVAPVAVAPVAAAPPSAAPPTPEAPSLSEEPGPAMQPPDDALMAPSGEEPIRHVTASQLEQVAMPAEPARFAEAQPESLEPTPSAAVPLERRRAAGALAAVSMAMDQTEVVADDDDVDENSSDGLATVDRAEPTPGPAGAEQQARRQAAHYSVVVAAPLGGASPVSSPEVMDTGTWEQLVAELAAEVDAAATGKQPDLRAALLLEMGRVLASRLGDWAGAEARFQAAVQAVPTFAPALRELVRLCAGRQEWARAVDLLARQAEGTTDGPTRTAALLGAAHIQLSQLDRLPEAAADLRRALEIYPANYVALRFLREIHYRTQDWPGLVESLRAARALAGPAEQLRIDYELGRLHDEVLKGPQASLAAFRACLATDPRFVPAFLACERILLESGDVASLGELWRGAARAWQGPDAAFWLVRAARTGDAASLPSRTVAGDYEEALRATGGSQSVAAEYRQWLEDHGRSEELAAHCEIQLDGDLSPEAHASILCTLARHAVQTGGDMAQSLDHLDEALKIDPENVEAQEGRRQALAAAQDWPALLAHLLASAESNTDLRVRVALQLKVAEIAEVCLNDLALARTHLETACNLAPNYLPALEALIQVLSRLGIADARAERLEQAAALVDSAEARSSYLLRASREWERAGRRDRVISLLGRAAEEGPGTLLAREWLGEALIEDRRWVETAELFRQAAAETQDTALRVSLLYRSARIALSRARDVDAAEIAYRSLLEIVPDFLPATMDLRDLLVSRGDWDAVGLLLQQEAEARAAGRGRAAWHRMAARAYDRSGRDEDALAQHRAALQSDPDDHASQAAIRRTLRNTGHGTALAEGWRRQLGMTADPVAQDLLRVELALWLVEAGDGPGLAAVVRELAETTVPHRIPWAALGIACEAQGQFTEASACYERISHQEDASADSRAAALFQQGLLAEEVRENPDQAAVCYEAVRAISPTHSMACEGLERVYAQRGGAGRLAAVYEAEAQNADTGPVRTFYALLAGEQRENLGEYRAAVDSYRLAFTDPVGRERAADAARRLGAHLRDGALMVEILSAHAAGLTGSDARSRKMDLADGLLSIGDDSAAAGVLRDLTATDPDFVAGWLLREHVHADREEWNDVVSCLESMQAIAASELLRRRLDSATKRVLQERGVTSEAAFDYYRKLQEREPENVAALRGLAGIAFARGQHDEAKLYLEEVLRLATEPALKADAATMNGQILVEADNDLPAAVKCFEAALQAVPNHKPAIEALKRVHSAAGSWNALVGVLARESSQAQPERRLAIFIEIARLWEDQIKNLKVATSSWQKVLQEEPRNIEALDRLLRLYERMEDWTAYLDVGERAMARLVGVDLRDRQAQLGAVAAERAGQIDRGVALLRTAASAHPPSVTALATLRRIARSRGDWEQVVQLAEQEADLVMGVSEQVALLEEAAKIRLDQVLDREGAAPLFRRVLELEPNNTVALQFFVAWAFDAGDWTSALPVFERYEPAVAAMDEDDDDARIENTAYHYKFGVVLEKNGRPADALQRFQRALELTPTHLPSLEASAPCWFALGQWEKARDTYRTILRLRGGAGDASTLNGLYLHLGQAEIKLGDVTNAQKRFKKILDQNPNQVDALIGLAQIHRLTEDWNSLLSTYNGIIKYARDPDQVIEAYMTKGDVLEQKLQFTDKAVLHYEKVLMYDRANVPAMTRLGQISLKRDEVARARELAERAVAAARNPGERAQALLLARLVEAGGEVNVPAILDELRRAADVDGDVLEAFGRSAGVSILTREAASNAYRDTISPL